MSNIIASSDHQTSASTECGPILRTVRRLLLRPAHAAAVETVSPCFRLIELAGDGIKGQKWSAGQHIQISIGPCRGLIHRTYTPMSWNTEGSRISILVFLHGNAPGCEWMRNVKVNDPCEVMGPVASFPIPGKDAPLVLFGDETCFGLAVGISQAMGSTNLQCIFEVSDASESQLVLNRFGLHQATLVQRSDDNAHLVQVNAEFAHWVRGGVQFALAGNARSIQSVKTNLAGLAVGSSRIKVKPYWAPGKTGLD